MIAPVNKTCPKVSDVSDRMGQDCRKTSRLLRPELHNDQSRMLSFLRRLWTYTRPYKGRLFLGLFFGILYAITNGLLVVIVQLAVKVLFATPGSQVSVAASMKKLSKVV